MRRSAIDSILLPMEKRILGRLDTPAKIQDYLDTLPINFEISGETYMSPRRVMREKTAHCFEGALFAALACAYHGKKPLLMDFRTIPEDEDHVLAIFQENGRWGAISKTNHPILRYRDPVYASPRELALSYFHEYIHRGRKSLRAYSAPFHLSRYPLAKWVTAEEDLFWLVSALDESRHFPIAPKKIMERLRKVSKIELTLNGIVEWKKHIS